MPIRRTHDPVKDSSAVTFSGGGSRHLVITGEEPPYFVLIQPGDQLFYVTEEPWYYNGPATSAQVLTVAPSSNIPEGVRHWVVDTNTTHQTHVGFGVLEQYGQDYAANQTPTPEWLDETAERLAALGITWGMINAIPGVRSDADYYQTWFDNGCPSLSSAPHGTAWRAHRHWPCDSGSPQYFFSFLEMKMPALLAHKAAVEAEGDTFKWYIKFSQYDDTTQANADKPGNAFILSDFPDRYAEIWVAIYDWLEANYPTVYPPTGIDCINEMAFDNRWGADNNELRDAILATRTALLAAGHPEPLWIVPSYQDPDLFNSTRADVLWTTNSGLLQPKLQWSSHMYGHGGTGSGARTATSNIASVVSSRGGSYLDTECIWTPLHCITQLARGRCGGFMHFGAVIGISSVNDLFLLNKNNAVGSQVSDQNNTKANRLIWQAIRPGYVRVETTRTNLVDTDDAECVVYRNPSTNKYSGVAAINQAAPIWVQLPAGTYRLRRVLCTVGSPYAKTTITIQSTDYSGSLHTISTGQGLHLNGPDNDAAGIFSFIQE